MAITDGEFFSLFKRMLQKVYKDPSGTPSLTSDQLKRACKEKIVTSAGANWTRIYIDRAVYIWTADRRQIDYISGYHPGDLSADTTKPWNSSISGVAKLYAPGEWHVKCPPLTGDTEGGTIPLIITDAALGVEGVNLTSADVAAVPPPVATNPNRSSWASTFLPIVTADGAHALRVPAQAVPNGYKVCVEPHPDNTGRVWIGPTQAAAQAHTTALPKDPGAAAALLAVSNWNAIWMDAAVVGEGIVVSSEV